MRGIRFHLLALFLGACFEPVGPGPSDGSRPTDGSAPADAAATECTGDSDCHARRGADWFCSGGFCIQGEPDSGPRADSGSVEDAGLDAGTYSYPGCADNDSCSYETLACAARQVAERFAECSVASDCVLEFWQGGCAPVCQDPINKVHVDEYRAALGTEVYAYCACATNPPSVACGPANPPLDCIAGRCARARPVDGGVPDGSVELPDAGVEPADAGTPDACTPETDSQLCSALGLTCGPGRGVDLCGVVRTLECGPCGTLPLCGPGVAQPCERICSWQGFCWAYPQPLGGAVMGIDGVSRDDLWFVGAFGATLHWDGQSLKRVESGTGALLKSVAALSSTDVRATGLADLAAGTLGPGALRWDGSAWSAFGQGGLSILAFAPDDVWVDGSHWDGLRWTGHCQLCGMSAFAAHWAASPSDFWFYELGELQHFDGASWTSQHRFSASYYRSKGGIAGTGPADIWAGSGDVFVHWDGLTWSTALRPSAHRMTGAFALDQDVWTLFEEEVYRRSPSGWELAFTLPDSEQASRMWTDGTEAWFANPSLLRWDGAAFTNFQQPRKPVGVWRAWGPANDLWAVSSYDAQVGRWTGNDWTSFDLSNVADVLWDVTGTGPDDVWVVGTAGAIAHWDGKQWTPSAAATPVDLTTVFATAPDDAWAAGKGQTLLHWDGLTWSKVANPTSRSIVALWGTAPDDLWAADRGAGLLHFDGAGWANVTLPTPANAKFFALWGSSRDDVWAFGEYETSPSSHVQVGVHWDGASWTQALLPFWATQSLAACGRGSLRFVLSDGYLATWSGNTFEPSRRDLAFAEKRTGSCVVDDSGSLWLFLLDGAVLQRSGRWR